MLLAGFAKFEFTPAGGDIKGMFDRVDGSNDVKFSPIFDERYCSLRDRSLFQENKKQGMTIGSVAGRCPKGLRV